MNLATRRLSCDLYSTRRFAVERMARLPTLNGKEWARCLFWKCACEILAVNRWSRASSSIGSKRRSVSSAAAVAGLSIRGLSRIGGSMHGDLPKRSWNGE